MVVPLLPKRGLLALLTIVPASPSPAIVSSEDDEEPSLPVSTEPAWSAPSAPSAIVPLPVVLVGPVEFVPGGSVLADWLVDVTL